MVSNARNIQYLELLWHESAVKRKRAKLIEIATNKVFNHAKWETVVRAMLLARCGWECHGISLETGHAFTRSPPSTIRLDRPKKMATATIRHSTRASSTKILRIFSWVFSSCFPIGFSYGVLTPTHNKK